MSYVRMSDLAQNYTVPYSGEELQRVLKFGQRSGCPIVDEAGNITWETNSGVITARYKRKSIDEATSKRLQVAAVTLERRIEKLKDLKDDAIESLNAFVSGDTEEKNAANFTAGLNAARDMGDLRFGIYADAAEFVIYAPDALSAGELCNKKLDIEIVYSEMWNGTKKDPGGVSAMLQKAGEVAQKRASWDGVKAWFNGIKNAIFQVIEKFVDLVKALFAAIKSIFAFLLDNPSFLLYGAIAVGGLAVASGVGYFWFKYKQAKAAFKA